MNVFTYWEGPKPAYIDVCIASMEMFCGVDFCLITPETADDWIDGALHENWKKLKNPAHRADCIRVAVINKCGGLWVDCDTVFIRQLGPFSMYGMKFCYTRWDDGRALNGYFFGEKSNPVTSEWLSSINAILRKWNCVSAQAWTSFGEKILTPLLNRPDIKSISGQFDRRIFLPINIDRIPWVFFEPVHWSAFVSDDTVAFGLNNSWFRDNVIKFYKSPEPWIGELLINKLIADARL